MCVNRVVYRVDGVENQRDKVGAGMTTVITVCLTALVGADLIGAAEQVEGNGIITHHRFGMVVPSERQPAKKRAEQEEVDQNSFHDER